MSAELSALYQEVVLDHGRRPRNFGKLAGATHHAQGVNPLCGDELSLHVKLEDGVIRDVAFEGAGCAISRASASMMTGVVKGMRVEEAQALFGRFHAMVTQGPGGGASPAELGKLAVFSGVWEFPTRVKCATLGWHTLCAALEGKQEPVSTE
jgi:nitrogen fixation protein NifU and related proteins